MKRTRRLSSWLVGAGALGLFAGCEHLQPAPPVYPPPPPLVCPASPACAAAPESTPDAAAPAWPLETQLIDLPSALRLADGQNPEIAVARERISEALAQQERAEVIWLPHLNYGPAWARHDGQLQKSEGQVITTSRSSAFVGGGWALSLDLADAIYTPLAARQVTAARRAGAEAVAHDRLLDVALAYTDLLQVYAELQINAETTEHARRLVELTENYEKTGKGVAADTARARTEASIRESERLEIEGRSAVVSARLVQLLQLSPELSLRPIEPALAPMAIVPEQAPLPELLAQALLNRPELAENRALIIATLERWRAAKVAPLVPNLWLAYEAGGFGGGPNAFFGDFSGRSDFSAMAVWHLKNLGFGDRALQRERYAQHAQAVFRQNVIEADVANQVVSSFGIAFARRRELAAAQRAVADARVSYRLNEDRIRRAPDQGRPIELLQAIQALALARREYLRVVADYNAAQFRLYTAMGNPPLCALEAMTKVPIKEPTVPAKPAAPELPPPAKVDEPEKPAPQ